MSKVEIVDKSTFVKCNRCVKGKKCSSCNDTGKYKKENYILIAQQPDGQKIAFDVDNAGK